MIKQPRFWKYGNMPKRSEEKKKKSCEVAQLCPTLWDPMDCSLPGSSIHGIFQARVLEWVAISFSKRSESRDLNRYFTTMVNGIIHYSQKAEAIQVSVDKGMDKQMVVYP